MKKARWILQQTYYSFFLLFQEKYFSFMTMISPLDSICRKVTAEIILSVSGEISLRDGTNPTFLHLEIHTTTSQTIYIFINLHIFHWIRTCEGEGGSNAPFNQKIQTLLCIMLQFWDFVKKHEKSDVLNKGTLDLRTMGIPHSPLGNKVRLLEEMPWI